MGRGLSWEGGCCSQGWSGLAITDWLQLMPCQFIDAAQESTAAQLCPSGLKSSLLVPLGYMSGHIYDSKSAPIHHIVLLFKASPVFAHSPCAQNQPAFISDISATFLQCTVPRRCWNVNPRLCFPGQICLVVLSLFLCTLQAWGFQLHEPLVSLHHFILSHGVWWHEGTPSYCFFSSIGCGGDQQGLPSTCSTINAG